MYDTFRFLPSDLSNLPAMSLTLVSMAVLPNQADLYPKRIIRASFAMEGRNGSAISQLISTSTPSMEVVLVQV